MKKLFYFVLMGILFSCQSGNKSQSDENAKSNVNAEIIETTINVGGMHCDMCVTSIEKGVNELKGIDFVKASLEDSTAVVKFDIAQTDLSEIEKAIERRGYTIKDAS